MKLVHKVLILYLISNSSAFGDTIYNCQEDKIYETSYNSINRNLDSNLKKPSKEPKVITVVITEKMVAVKTAANEYIKLKSLGKNIYYDNSHSNISIWEVFHKKGNIPIYVFYHTALEITGPMAIDISYVCR